MNMTYTATHIHINTNGTATVIIIELLNDLSFILLHLPVFGW
tara:strand:- start:223 stop:348 length:126 start_codon:yes stop_codon:yes gene_type:complete